MIHSAKKWRKWLLGGVMELKLLPYWPFNRVKQFYFVDSDGKEYKCKRNLISIIIRKLIARLNIN